jgi:hypothetical protein
VIPAGTATWFDRQNNWHLTQPTGWAQPQLLTTGWNGTQPTLRFNGGNLLRAENWSVPPIGMNSGFAVLAVMRSAAPQHAGIASWWSEWGDGVWAAVRSTNGLTLLDYHRLDDATFTQLHSGDQDLGCDPNLDTACNQLSGSGLHVVAWRFSPSTQTATLTVDGAHSVSAPQPPVGNVTAMPFIVGALSPLPTGFFQGDISELVIVGDEVSDEDVQYFTAYARNTWSGLPAGPGSGPCIKADGQPSPNTIRCDDGNPDTVGDHCSAGSCAGTVPAPSSPKDLSPVAWYYAAESEVVITYDGVSTWYDRSPGHRDLMNGYWGRPDLVPDGWDVGKPTVQFTAANALKLLGWTGTPTGTEAAFTVLAVMRSDVASQNSGVVSWFYPSGYGQIAAKIKPSGSVTALDLYRLDGFLNTQEYLGNTGIGTARHAVAWRYANGVVKLTVDGLTQVNPRSPIGLIPTGVWFFMGIADGFGGGPFSGDISELAVIPGSISDPELANFNAYAQAEWGGLTIACTPNCAGKALGEADGCGGNCGCDLSAPFDAPVAAFTGPMDADGLTFSADGLTAYISGAGPGNRDIYVTTRSSPEGAFGTPTLVTALNTPGIERAPSLSPDGKLYFTQFGLSGSYQIGRGVRTGSVFTGLEVVPAPISSAYQDEDPFWWGNDTLYFVSEVDNGGAHRDIWKATLSGETFSQPTKVQGQGLNSGYEEFHPVLSPDGLTLYFGSRRYGIGGDTNGDVWMARRQSTEAAFLPPINLWGLNNTGNDYPVTIADNGCTLYFASDEEVGLGASNGHFRLYKASRGVSTPALVTLRLNILGQGSVNSGPFSCGPGNAGTCSATRPPDTTMGVDASGPALWTGSCAGNGSGNPSTDGVLVFSPNAVCTVKFPGAALVGQGGLCSLSMDCADGRPCVNNMCGGCVPEAPPPDDMNPCTADVCDPMTGASHTPLPEGTSCTLSGGADGVCDGAGTCEPRTPGDCNGSGARNPTEECDDGAGSEADLCSACRVTDALAVRGPASGLDRYLGESRHPVSAGPHGFAVAFVEPDSEPPVIGLSVFDAAGDPRARLDVSSRSTPVLFSSPAVAALDDGSFAVAWTDFGRDGDELGVALRRVRPAAASGSSPPVSGATLEASLTSVQFANSERDFSQSDPDILRVGDHLIVAWTDTSIASTAPDIRYRTFQVGSPGSSSTFRALGDEQSLAATREFEGNVALAPFGTSWVAAWRAGNASGEETIEVALPEFGARWSIGPDLPGAPEDKPALAELDADHLAVLFTVGTDPDGSDVSNVPRLVLAVLNVDNPEPVAVFAFEPADEDYADPAIAQSHPSLVRAGDVLYASWRAGSLFGNVEAENVFLRELGWDGELFAEPEIRIPRATTGSRNDQRFPALAVGPPQIGTPSLPNPAPQGSLVIAWDDYGRQFGSAQGRPDVLVQFWPLPVLRFEETP